MKNCILVAPWANYNDVGGGNVFANSVSEPVTEQEANRMVAAMGCRSIKFPSEEIAQAMSEEGRERLTPEAHEQMMLEGPLQVDYSEVPVDPEFRAVEPGGPVNTDENVELGQKPGNPGGEPLSSDSVGEKGLPSAEKATSQDDQEGASVKSLDGLDPAPKPTGLPATKESPEKKKK